MPADDDSMAIGMPPQQGRKQRLQPFGQQGVSVGGPPEWPSSPQTSGTVSAPQHTPISERVASHSEQESATRRASPSTEGRGRKLTSAKPVAASNVIGSTVEVVWETP